MKIVRFLSIPIVAIVVIGFLFYYFQYFSRATAVKANLVIDVKRTTGTISPRWLSLAQGGEEKGVRMLGNVVADVAALSPNYIRLDHLYDYYDVVSRSADGNLAFQWDQLDATICDIYQTGAKPFLSLSYMPPALSSDGSVIAAPNNWEEWSLVVQRTVERYSGTATQLCGQYSGDLMKDIYYEVWNEPDLELFGKWSYYGGDRDYKKLYYYSVQGANRAQNAQNFFIGGPVTTKAYKNWVQGLLNYIAASNLRIDFLSWHHYSKDTDDYTDDAANFNAWLSEPQYQRFQSLPRIISEWGYDSEPNPIADTNIGAAHTVASIRNFSRYNFALAFLFEIKDGPKPSWGLISYSGEKKPRYYALQLLNKLEGTSLNVEGEGTHVRAMASISPNKTTVILVNYDKDNKNNEAVPLTINNIQDGSYTFILTYLDGTTTTIRDVAVTGSIFQRSILMPPNMVVAVELQKQ